MHGRIRPNPPTIQRAMQPVAGLGQQPRGQSRLRSPACRRTPPTTSASSRQTRAAPTKGGRSDLQNAPRAPDRHDGRGQPRWSATSATLNGKSTPTAAKSGECSARIRPSRAPMGATHRAVHRQDPGAALWRPRQRSAALTPTRPTTSASRRPTPAAPATAPMKRSRRPRPRQPSRRESASAVSQTSATLNAQSQSQRRGSQRMQARIRAHERVRRQRSVRAVTGVREYPGDGHGNDHGPRSG